MLQYFVAFGVRGMWGAAAVAATMTVIGLVILQFGSYYQAQEHTAVLSEVTHPWVSKFFDAAVVLTVFSIGVVMFAGAGATVKQQFGWPALSGSVILLAIVLVVGRLDVDRVSRVIGAITPGIIVCIAIGFGCAVAHAPANLAQLAPALGSIQTQLPNPWIAALNYAGFSMMVPLSMSVVIGGYYLHPRIAGLGGFIGGAFFGLLLLSSAIALYLKADVVAHQELPMLALVAELTPWLGIAMALAIYGMILNSAIGMFYALGRRFSGEGKNFYLRFVVIVLVGFGLGFIGFKNLVTYLFPVLGYLGVVLTLILCVAWVRERVAIVDEAKRRHRIVDLVRRHRSPGTSLSRKERRELRSELQSSNIEDAELHSRVSERVDNELAGGDSADHI